VGEIFQELCKQFNIKQKFSTSYHPQSQGSVERANRSIINLMRNFVNSKQTDWDLYVSPLTYALNSSDNSPLGYSAYMLVFGRVPTMPSEQDLEDPLNNAQTVQDHFDDILETQLECHNYAMKHLKKEQARMKQRYDSKSHDAALKIGDIVYVYQPRLRVRNTKKKLQKSFHGPFMVMNFRTQKAVVLRRLSDGKILDKSISVDRLKRGSLRANVNRWDPIPDEVLQGIDELDDEDIPNDSFSHANDGEGVQSGCNDDERNNSNDQNNDEVVDAGNRKKRRKRRNVNLSAQIDASAPPIRTSKRSNKGQKARNSDYVY